MHDLLNWITQYGYAGLFALLMLGIVGLPIPDETILVLCGVLISKGRLHPVGTFLTALAGSVSGITISYFIGRTLGYSFIHRFGKYVHLTEERFAKLDAWFEKIGHWLLVVGYFIAGVRHFTAVSAGISRLPFGVFALFAYGGAALWVSIFLGLGYFVGDNWENIMHLVHRYTIIFTIVLAVLAAAFLFYQWKKKRAAKIGTLPGEDKR